MNTRSTVFALGVATLFLLVLTDASYSQDKVVRIGGLFPTSGPGAYFGTQDKQGIDLGVQAGEFRGPSRALQRGGQHEREVVAGDQPAGTSCEILSAGRERNVGETRVSAGLGPLRLAVAEQDQIARRVIWCGAVGQRIVCRHTATVVSASALSIAAAADTPLATGAR